VLGKTVESQKASAISLTERGVVVATVAVW